MKWLSDRTKTVDEPPRFVGTGNSLKGLFDVCTSFSLPKSWKTPSSSRRMQAYSG